MLFLEICLLFSLFIWIYLWLGRDGFWKTDTTLLPVPCELSMAWPTVHVLVPARDEAAMLPATLPTLLDQRYPGELHIFLIDDQSTDGTAGVARKIVRDRNAAAGLTVIETVSGPAPGWSGKLWALEQGLRKGAGSDADYLLFTDADIAHEPESLQKLVAAARKNDLDLVSLMATLRTDSFWARLLLPAFVYFFAMLYPFRQVNRADCPTAAAAGGCVLLRCKAFMRAGGLAPIAGALIDDCSLGRLIKSRGRKEGGRIWLGLGREVISLRNSHTLREIWHMVRRTAYVQLRHSNVLLAATVVGMTLVFIAPVAGVIVSAFLVASGMKGGGWVFSGLTGLAAWILMSRTYLAMTRWYGRPAGYAATLPLAGFLYTLMTLDSAWCFWRKKGGGWKGRTYGCESGIKG
jgi:hopene-associated glycosyltransferase HpnB